MSDYFYWFDKIFNDGMNCRYLHKRIEDQNKELLIVDVGDSKKEDITIEIKTEINKDFLYIYNSKSINWSNIRFGINASLVNEVEAEVKDGLLYVTILKKDNKPKINIKF
jgi:uncharacterized UPF0160 family protein